LKTKKRIGVFSFSPLGLKKFRLFSKTNKETPHFFDEAFLCFYRQDVQQSTDYKSALTGANGDIRYIILSI